MPDKPAVTNFFADLDSVLDTRLGTILRLDPEFGKRIIKSCYFTRDRDQFQGIDVKAFQDLYKQRDRETIKASMITPILGYMKDFIKESYEMNIQTPFIREPKLVINLFPYQLTSGEKDLIESALVTRTGESAEVKFVFMSPAEITPSYLLKETSIVAMYDPYTWLDTLAENKVWDKQSCPNVMLISPLLIRDLSLREIDISKFQQDMEFIAKPFVDLHLLAVSAFSADIFPKKKEPKVKDDLPPMPEPTVEH